MAATDSALCDFGWEAVDFSLKSITGKTVSLADVKGENGLLVMFICNHCPFVTSAIDRIIDDCRVLKTHGIGAVAIMSNDTEAYPADSFENMIMFAINNKMPFPYLIDEDQSVARAYNAQCTPEFFGFNADLELQYRGRLDEGRTSPPPPSAPRELLRAMRAIAETGRGPREQHTSIGCSIKWKRAG